MTQPVLPVGVAVHTRGNQHGEDYGWYLKVGSLSMFTMLEELHLAVLCEKSGYFPPLAVVIQRGRIGLLIANLPGPREDHVSGVIYDTLYLEFDLPDQAKVFKTVASMILMASQPEKEQYIRHFIDYTEKLYVAYQGVLQTTMVSLKELVGVKLTLREDATHLNATVPVSLSTEVVSSDSPTMSHSINQFYQECLSFLKETTLPLYSGLDKLEEGEENLEILRPAKLLLPFSDASCQQCVKLLLSLANVEMNSFCFVSADNVRLDKCQQVAAKVERCVMLVQSAEVLQLIDLNGWKLGNWLSKLTKKLQQK
ncbi:MAG: hypothetical protein BWK78_00655 [Thiotrichaceae bacterium IS1]|nr:MAG: hypothetical protein BWK78_00655 [Thiotrichaceae bacterium IS1]